MDQQLANASARHQGLAALTSAIALFIVGIKSVENKSVEQDLVDARVRFKI